MLLVSGVVGLHVNPLEKGLSARVGRLVVVVVETGVVGLRPENLAVVLVPVLPASVPGGMNVMGLEEFGSGVVGLNDARGSLDVLAIAVVAVVVRVVCAGCGALSANSSKSSSASSCSSCKCWRCCSIWGGPFSDWAASS